MCIKHTYTFTNQCAGWHLCARKHCSRAHSNRLVKHMYMYVCISVNLQCTHTDIHTCMQNKALMRTRMCEMLYMFRCVRLYVFMDVRMHVQVCSCTFIQSYVDIHTYACIDYTLDTHVGLSWCVCLCIQTRT